MGYVLPGWVDEVLDFIGINWPNVDEDDYREMADAMREFADKFEGHGGDAHAAVSRVLASSEGYAVDALQEHWSKVKTSHLDEVPAVARLFADACDVVADVIYGMKTKAEIELGVMAASIGLLAGAAIVTGGLAALVGAAETAAMRELIRRIIKEAAEEIVAQLVAKVTEPVTAKLEKMAEDMVLDLADDALSLPPGTGGGEGAGAGADAGGGGEGGGHHGKGAMSLDSVGGGSGGAGGGAGGGGQVRIDHDEYEHGAQKLSRHGQDLNTAAAGSLGRAQGAFGRTKGRDPFTQAFDSVLHGALNGAEKAMKKVAKHVTDGVPGGIRASSRNHKRTDQDLADKLKGTGSRADGDGPNGGNGVGGRKRWDQARSKLQLTTAQMSQKARRAWCKTFGNDPIDMATGEMFLSQVDLQLPGVLPLVLRRTHISSYRSGVFFGPSWASSLDERLERGDGGIWWHRDDGSSLIYEREPDLLGDTVLPAEGEPIPLTCVQEGSQYALAIADPFTGLTRTFRPQAEGNGDGVWWLADIEDRNANAVTIERGVDGMPTDVLHTGGYHVEIGTDAESGLVISLEVRTPAGRTEVTAYGYDAHAHLVAVTNSSGHPLRFTYDDAHRITSWRDRNDSTFRYIFDERGRVVRTIGPDGYLSSQLAYVDADRVTRYTDSLGATTTYRMNARGQVIAVTDPLGNTVQQEWDHRDHLLSRTDPLGHTTRLEWDEAGDVIAIREADGSRTQIEHNRLHLATTITRPDGAVWRHDYDARGNRTAFHAPDGSTTTFTHAASGAITSITDPAAQTVSFTCDGAGLPLTVTDPTGATTEHRYDSFGRLVSLTDPLGGITHLAWTVEGQLAAQTTPDGATQRWSYDGEGNCTRHTDPLGQSTSFRHTHFDLPTARTGPNGAQLTFRHDTELRLTHVTDPQGLTWEYVYDAVGQLIAETDFDGRTVTYTYDGAGRLTGRTNAAGQHVAYAYDSLGNLVRKELDGQAVTFENDACGRLLHASGPDADLTFGYDAVGRLLSENVDGRTLAHACDAAGRRTQRITPTGATTTYTYDAAGHRASLTASGRTLSFEHNAIGRETSRRLGDSLVLTHTWDAAGRLAEQALTTPDSSPLRQRGYTYRPDGHLLATRDQDRGARTFDLDSAGRVTAVSADDWSESYTYDAAGNQIRAQWPEQFPAAQTRGDRVYTGTRLISAGHLRYEHDAQGRVVLRQKTRLSRKPDTWHFTWDAEDRLTSCTTPDGTRWRYLYDPLGRRIAKQRLRDDDTIAEETRFTWDGATLAEATTHTSDSPESITLTWDHNGFTPLAQTETKALAEEPQHVIDQRFFAIVTDQIGAPTELVDETGHIAWQSRATLWGTTTWNRDATAYTPLRFPGQYFDPETQLHHNYFRHYDPETARYLTLDPLGLDPGPNPSTYVTNPHAASDPLGLSPCDEGDPTWGDRVQYGELGPHGRATSMHATVTKDMLGGKTNPRVDPAGWESDKGYNRAHLLAAMIGGSNKDPRNFVTMHAYANSPEMRHVELQVRKAAKDGEIVQYSVTPVYADANSKIPSGVTLEAHGDRGFQFTPRGSTEPTNSITLPNRPKPS